jgi:hypothetical protein
MSTFNSAGSKQDIFLPWTLALPKSFKDQFGTDLVDLLPQIVWESSGNDPHLPRYQFLDHVCELFTSNYVGILAQWCRNNRLFCTGHMNAVRQRRREWYATSI